MRKPAGGTNRAGLENLLGLARVETGSASLSSGRKMIISCMHVELPDAVLDGTGMTPELAALEVAVALYRDHKVGMGRAARLAGMPRPQFQRELGLRGVVVDYEVEDLHEDLAAFRDLRRG
jgi:predicted HTH domain antitoxin